MSYQQELHERIEKWLEENRPLRNGLDESAFVQEAFDAVRDELIAELEETAQSNDWDVGLVADATARLAVFTSIYGSER
ncbi:MAG: hypothetical protein QM729_21260 [Solirubrobacterales bacterium]